MPSPIRTGGFLAGSSDDRPGMAAALMVGALFLLGLQDGFVKMASYHMSLWQFQLLRSAMNLALLMLVMRFLWGSVNPRPKRFWAVALRSLLLVATMVMFFGGVPVLSLAEIGAGLYVFPLFVAVLSALVLREHVGPRRVVAIMIGFTGTLLILKPGTEAFRPISLLPVGAAFSYACMIMVTRRLCRQESPLTLAYGVAVTFMIFGTLGVVGFGLFGDDGLAQAWPYLFSGWHPIDGMLIGLIVLCSLFNLVANVSLAKAYQSAEASWLAPFDYSYLVFATFWGFVFWRHVPDGLTFLGMALIAAAGAFVAWREQRAKAEYNKRIATAELRD